MGLHVGTTIPRMCSCTTGYRMWMVSASALSSVIPPHLSGFWGLGVCLLLCLRSPSWVHSSPLPEEAPGPVHHVALFLVLWGPFLKRSSQEPVCSLSTLPSRGGHQHMGSRTQHNSLKIMWKLCVSPCSLELWDANSLWPKYELYPNSIVCMKCLISIF